MEEEPLTVDDIAQPFGWRLRAYYNGDRDTFIKEFCTLLGIEPSLKNCGKLLAFAYAIDERYVKDIAPYFEIPRKEIKLKIQLEKD